MAFNFNWSPLIADTERVRDMLTNALNKSPKPPIIVDDIVVNELNLGSTPPELEILEIGDLAEDKFRGIFRMSYTGDAYLTLKTKVQANPLNTYLSAKPTFASPQPLAANSSLTIPIQITLSDIWLSGFVILVFSKQKGITIVFRNDPLESLKVSSTFDSIPFVRDYLQKTIESQLRDLFMEDLPAIIHRLSLRHFSSEYPDHPPEGQDGMRDDTEEFDRRFSSSLQQSASNRDTEESSSFLFDSPSETYASFSQRSLLRLAALTESHRTLSLFTPSISDTVYRAWTSTSVREELSNGTNTPMSRPTAFGKFSSPLSPPNVWSSAASQVSDPGSYATRPSIASVVSTSTMYSLGSGASRSRTGKKRKNRVVNLRKNKLESDIPDATSITSSYDESTSRSASGSAESVLARKIGSETLSGPASSNIREGEISTPPRSPPKKVGFQDDGQDTRGGAIRPRPTTPKDKWEPLSQDDDPTPRPTNIRRETLEKRPALKQLPVIQPFPPRSPSPEVRRSSDIQRSSSELKLISLFSSFGEGNGGGILEQAWMTKMATEIARKVAEEKSKQQTTWPPGSDDGAGENSEAPPAYVS